MVGTRRLTDLASAAFSRCRLPDGKLIVALSGGADSAALAWLISQNGFEPGLVHVNHSLPASQKMEKAARAVAERLDVDLEVLHVELEDGPSFEAAARNSRYEALDTVDGHVLTGHTADDNAETVLINLIRGTGLDGLTGIPYHRPPHIYRPILEVTRSVTRELSTLAGLPFADDPANSDPAFTRNRVRGEVMPVLSQLNPQIVGTINRMATNLEGDAEYLAAQTPHVSDRVLPVSVALTLPEALAGRLLIEWLRANDVEVSAGIMSRVWDVINGGSNSQELENGVVVERKGAVVEIVPVG